MTNKEAIKILEVAQVECEWNAPLEYQEAFKMAIEALKEQPEHSPNTSSKQPDLETLGIKTGETCEDVISRQDAVDAKQEFRNPNVVRNTEARTAYDRTYANGWNDCNLAWINAIEALPSAQPEIIHCKDCKHSEHWYRDKARCFLWHEQGIDVFEDGYCSYAERKEGDTDG